MKPTPIYRIIIDCDGNNTKAYMIINGKEVKTAAAKRNPKDKHDWKMAAHVAFDRLWQRKEKQVEQKQEGVFKVGDRVVIKSNAHRWIVGKAGKIVSVEGNLYGVETDEAHETLHTCGLQAKANHGWYCFADEFSHEKPTKPEVREVKRIAKVGEYIKLINCDYTFDKPGNILRVDETSHGLVFVYGRNHPYTPDYYDEKISWSYSADQYVVLEGYKPEGK